jgi:hypothetical protein
MSNTRRAEDNAPLRQERYCSAPEFSQSLAAIPVAKRCEILDDAELRELIWFLQVRSLPNRDGMGGRIGSVRAIARELLLQFPPEPIETLCEDFDLRANGYSFRSVIVRDPAEIAECYIGPLTDALFDIALNPTSRLERVPGLGDDARGKLRQYRAACVARAELKLAPTTVSQMALDSLNFTLATGKASLMEGRARTGKSETAKAFCECQPGIARYVEVPSTNDEKSLYKAVAEALGVADGASYTGLQIRERVEDVLRRTKFMLVFDEAQNLWPRRMRPTSVPARVLWVMSLMNLGAPVAFMALPEFSRWMDIVAEKTAWSKAQIEGRVARRRTLPEQLTEADLNLLVRAKAPELSEAGFKALVSAARLHPSKSAAVVIDAIASARYIASRRGANAISFDDLRQAISDDWLPIADATLGADSPGIASALPVQSKVAPARSSPMPVADAAIAPPVQPVRALRATLAHKLRTNIAAQSAAPANARQIGVDVTPG